MNFDETLDPAQLIDDALCSFFFHEKESSHILSHMHTSSRTPFSLSVVVVVVILGWSPLFSAPETHKETKASNNHHHPRLVGSKEERETTSSTATNGDNHPDREEKKRAIRPARSTLSGRYRTTFNFCWFPPTTHTHGKTSCGGKKKKKGESVPNNKIKHFIAEEAQKGITPSFIPSHTYRAEHALDHLHD